MTDSTDGSKNKKKISYVLFIIGMLIIYGSISEYFLYKINVTASSMEPYTKPNMDIQYKGVFNLNAPQSTFIIQNNCDYIFSNSDVLTHEANNCKNTRHGTILNVICANFNKMDSIKIMFRPEPPQNCVFSVSYSPMEITERISIPIQFKIKQAFKNMPLPRGIYLPADLVERYNISDFAIVDNKSLFETYYAGSQIIIKYGIVSANQTNITFTHELLDSYFNLIDKNPRTEKIEIKDTNKIYSYNFWHYLNLQGDYTEVIAHIVAKNDKNDEKEAYTTINILINKSLIPHVINYESINWNNNVTFWLLSNLNMDNNTVCDYSTLLLNLTRNKIKAPLEVYKKEIYNSNEIDSLSSFNEGYGTSSELNAVYVMFNRILGIPAKYNSINNTYSSSIFLGDNGWIDVDISNSTITSICS